MADTVDNLIHIPRIMEKRGWKVAAALMRRWLTGPPSDDRSKQPADSTDVKLSWALAFARCGSIYSKMIADRIWENGPAIREINNQLLGRKVFSGLPATFGNLDFPVAAVDKGYINERAVPSSFFDPLDDLFGALGAFNIRVAVEGLISPTDNGKPIVSLKRVGMYIQDKYDFQGDQVLGFWKFDGDGDVSKLPGLGYDLVSNETFRAYRKRYKKGGDFWVYSDVKIIPLHNPVSFRLTL